MCPNSNAGRLPAGEKTLPSKNPVSHLGTLQIKDYHIKKNIIIQIEKVKHVKLTTKNIKIIIYLFIVSTRRRNVNNKYEYYTLK